MSGIQEKSAQISDDLRSIVFRMPEHLARYEEEAIDSAREMLADQSVQIAKLQAELTGAYAGAAELRRVIGEAISFANTYSTLHTADDNYAAGARCIASLLARTSR